MNKLKVVSVLFVLALVAGCGKGHVPLQGKVTFSDDGSPLTTGNVNFVNGSFQSRAPLQPDGTYTVGTYKASDGLPPGKYSVYVTGAVKVIGEAKLSGDIGPTGEVTGGGMPITEPLIAPKFSSANNSGLEFEAGSAKTFDFKVDRYVKR
ncbi:MAG: hypothetical protein FWH27_00900 [Planctomycetaceae bacterium]|nr:hypothetical protein [Planctomycetaceae bacterium]